MNEACASQWRAERLQFSLIDSNFRSALLPEQHEHTVNASFGEKLVVQYCDGQWATILKTDLVLKYFKISPTEPACFLSDHTGAADQTDETLIQLVIIATLLSVYVQVNFTGPSFPFEPIELFESSSTLFTEDQINANSLDRLSLAGEPAYHLAKFATFLTLALNLIDRLTSLPQSSTSRFPSIYWWKLRANLLQRRLLDDPVAFSTPLLAAIDDLSQRCLAPLNQSPSFLGRQDDWDMDLLPILTLERGLAEHLTGNEKKANSLFRQAIGEVKLEYLLTGRLGKRTKFQEKDISQLVVLAKGRTRTTQDPISSKDQTHTEGHDFSQFENSRMPVTLALDDDTLLEKTQFTSTTNSESALDPEHQVPLHPLEQCTLLALALSIKNTSPSHGLTKAQMSPFIEKVLECPANWSVHSMALLIRSRLESHRTRTVERGLLQLQALVDQMTKEASSDPVDKSTALERIRWTWCLSAPSKWELERELAQKLSAMGVTRSALEIFEKLEMWEHVVQCHLSLGSKEMGIRLVKELLSEKKIESELIMSKRRGASGHKRRAKLWCLLAELESDPLHWQTAWEVSQQTSSRSMRSLGVHHFTQGDHLKAMQCLSAALKINPLFPKVWFIYGCAAMRQSSWDEAEVAFRRCINLDDEDAEAWNNLATVYLKRATPLDELRSGPVADPASVSSSTNVSGDHLPENVLPVNAVTPDQDGQLVPQPADEVEVGAPVSWCKAAFHALQQAVKLSYESWRMWTNYMVVAISVAEYTEATRALGRVVEIRGEQGLDEAILSRLVETATSKMPVDHATNTRSRLLERLEDVMDRIILVKCPNSPAVWEGRAGLCKFTNDIRGAIDKQLTAYRVGVSQSTDNWMANEEGWRKAVQIVDHTIGILTELGPRLSLEDSSSVKWRWQCKTILKSFLSKSKDAFEDTELWVQVEARLQDFQSNA